MVIFSRWDFAVLQGKNSQEKIWWCLAASVASFCGGKGKCLGNKKSFQQYRQVYRDHRYRAEHSAPSTALAEGFTRRCHGPEPESHSIDSAKHLVLTDNMQDCCKGQRIRKSIVLNLPNARHFWASDHHPRWQMKSWDLAGIHSHGFLWHSSRLVFPPGKLALPQLYMKRWDYLWYHVQNYSLIWSFSSPYFSCFPGWPGWQKNPVGLCIINVKYGSEKASDSRTHVQNNNTVQTVYSEDGPALSQKQREVLSRLSLET